MDIIKTYPCDARNYSKRKGKIEYIVIHYVGATGGAKANAIYYGHNDVGASAHFFVGHASEGTPVYQSVDPKHRAWHCGSETGKYKHPYCRNDNSIGIEICCHYDEARGWYFDKETVDTAVELTKHLMQLYSVPIEKVIRHYDVTGKCCPAPFVNDESAWTSFKNRLITAPELTEPNDIVWELAHRGIVTDSVGMLDEMDAEPNGRLYWLARKVVRFMRKNNV
ncbi:MAG: N-acetylmuramoyl-L-alanine amidase [Clostridia bacterium]|nr:N-acetylmuramoyl-L-alanine amidase [Clostridia bacterium]